MKGFLLLIILCFACIGLSAQFFSLNFEDEGGYSSSITEFTDGGSDFFIRTNGSDIGSYTLGNIQGNFYFAAQDIDGEGASLPVSLTIENIDISDQSELSFSVFIAEDDDGSNEDWDASDYVHFDYKIDDNESYSALLHIESEGGTNTVPRIDTNFDGTGDGVEITDEFTKHTVSIANTGSTLDLRITFQLDSGDEDLAIDNIEFTGVSNAPALELSENTLNFSSFISGQNNEESKAVVLSGSNLSGSIFISAPENMELSPDDLNFSQNTLELSPTDGFMEETTFYCRFISSTSHGEYEETVLVSTSGANDQGINCNVIIYPAAFSSLVINEIDVDTYSTDLDEFIELYDGGIGNTPLDGLCLVMYNGSDDESYAAYDLDSYQTNGLGYFLLGSSQIDGVDYAAFTSNGMQNGTDALALYLDDATNFPNSTALKTEKIIDAIVYHTNDTPDVELLTLLNPSEPAVDEDLLEAADLHSLQRIPNGSGGQRSTGNFSQAHPTPGRKNFDEVWQGSISELWTDDANWIYAQPGEGDMVYIPVVHGNMPKVNQTSTIHSLYLENNANLQLQENLTVTNSTFILHHITASSESTNLDRWQYFSSPFTSVVSEDFLSENHRIDLWISSYNNQVSNSFDEAWESISKLSESFEPGKGLALTYVYDAAEEGKLISGNEYLMRLSGNLPALSSSPNINLQYSGEGLNNWNLIGNPYLCGFNWFNDSHLDFSLIGANTAYLYDPNTGTYRTLQSTGDGNGLVSPSGSGIIPPMQGFFVKSLAAGNFELNKNARSNESSEFLKSTIGSSQLTVQVNIDSLFDQTSLLYNIEASPDYDDYDAEKLMGRNTLSPQISCLTSSEKRLVFNHSNLIHANYQLEIITNQPGNYKLFIESIEGEFQNNKILLDTGDSRFIDLRDEDFEFVTKNNPDTLQLNLSIEKEQGVNSRIKNPVRVKAENNMLLLTSSSSDETSVQIYNLCGKCVLKQRLKANETHLSPPLKNGIYIIKIDTEEENFIQKINILNN